MDSEKDYSLARYIGGRKAALALITICLAFVLAMLGKMQDSQYVTLNIAVVVAYITGDVWQNVNSKK